MDFFFCLPIIFGCQTKYKPEGDQTPRICPRCHNAAVTSVKAREWFELCFVPLVPMSNKHLWVCTICNWNAHVQPGGWEPTSVTNVMGPQQTPGYYPQFPNQLYSSFQSSAAPGQVYH